MWGGLSTSLDRSVIMGGHLKLDHAFRIMYHHEGVMLVAFFSIVLVDHSIASNLSSQTHSI